MAHDVTDSDGCFYDKAHVLVTGAHRLEAARRLGWETIEAFETDADETQAELWEIAENLHRADLTKEERDEQLARWIHLAGKQGVLSQLETKPEGGRPEGGVRLAARELGVGKDDAYRAVKVASLSDEAKEAAKSAGLQNNRKVLLDAAVKKTVAEQVAVIHARSAKIAPNPLNDFEAKEKQVQALMNAWNKAAPEAREEFLGRIDKPLMDRRYA